MHRPRYDDWSFPKGKVERNESVRTCAVREVAEETGVRIALGQPLETVRYKMSDGRRKRVYYWAARELGADEPGARARAAVTPASAREIDGVAWVRVKKARKQLTHAMDRDLLGSLVDLWEDGKLDTWTFVLVRHARAVKRSVWSRHRPKRVRDKEADEATRPLTHDQGEVRARALVPVLAAYGVGRVVSSPWRRCVDTVAPYAEAAGLDVVFDDRRKVSAGVKFADFELVGVPLGVVVGRGLKAGNVEVRVRGTGESFEVPVDAAAARVVELHGQLMGEN